MRPEFFQSLMVEAEANRDLHLLVADVGFNLVEPFAERFPERFLNVGIAEQNMISVAAGLALCGKTVFVYSLANFASLRCLEQIRNDLCYHQANVKVVSGGTGLSYGALGYTHHNIEDVAILRALPGLTVVSPGDGVESTLATRALARQPGPAYLRLGRSGVVVHQRPPCFELGKALVCRDGRDVTLVATGEILATAMEVANSLAAEGLSCGVLSMHTVSPLDHAALAQAAARAPRMVTLEEHSLSGGLGSAVAEWLVDAEMSLPLLRLGIKPGFTKDSGSQSFLRQRHGLDTPAVKRQICERFFVKARL